MIRWSTSITIVQYQCHNSVVGNMKLTSLGRVSLSVDDSLVQEYNNSSVLVSNAVVGNMKLTSLGRASLSVDDSLVYEYKNSSVTVSQCCGW